MNECVSIPGPACHPCSSGTGAETGSGIVSPTTLTGAGKEMDGWIYGWTDSWMDGWIYEWRDSWMDGWMDL